MEIRIFVHHLADKFLPIRPPYEKHALTEAISRTAVGFVLAGLLTVLSLCVFHGPVEASYLLDGVFKPEFGHRLLFSFELLLGIAAISYVLGRLGFGSVAWFQRYIPSKLPVWKIREFRRYHISTSLT